MDPGRGAGRVRPGPAPRVTRRRTGAPVPLPRQPAGAHQGALVSQEPRQREMVEESQGQGGLDGEIRVAPLPTPPAQPAGRPGRDRFRGQPHRHIAASNEGLVVGRPVRHPILRLIPGMNLRLHPRSVAPAEGPEKCGPRRPTRSGYSCNNASNAVAGIGIDSAIQKAAISMAAPAVSHPSTLRPGGGGSSSVSSRAAGPQGRPPSRSAGAGHTTHLAPWTSRRDPHGPRRVWGSYCQVEADGRF